jgi:hypothetical protein
MRTGFLGSLTALFLATSLAVAQPSEGSRANTAPSSGGTCLVVAPTPEGGGASPALPSGGTCLVVSPMPCCPIELCHPEQPCPPRIWVSGEYLLWWIRNGPLPIPLVTVGNVSDQNSTSSPAGPSAGSLGLPTTRVLYGGSSLDYGTFSGGRLTLGGWLDSSGTLGLEGRAFLLETRTTRFFAANSSNNNLILAEPFFDTDASGLVIPGENAEQLSFPGTQGGFIVETTSTRLWGAELNGLINCARRDGMSTDLLVGFRYLDLEEHFQNAPTTAINIPGTGSGITTGADDFGNDNRFYGAQVGARCSWEGDYLSADIMGKIALGSVRQDLSISGFNSIQNTTGFFTPSRVVPGKLFSQPTNIGNYTHSLFTAVPELEVRVGCRLTSQLTGFVSYNFLYWGDVARPGNQIDRVINGSQIGGFPLIGAPQPTPPTVFNESSFWAQGVSFGLEFKF